MGHRDARSQRPRVRAAAGTRTAQRGPRRVAQCTEMNCESSGDNPARRPIQGCSKHEHMDVGRTHFFLGWARLRPVLRWLLGEKLEYSCPCSTTRALEVDRSVPVDRRRTRVFKGGVTAGCCAPVRRAVPGTKTRYGAERHVAQSRSSAAKWQSPGLLSRARRERMEQHLEAIHRRVGSDPGIGETEQSVPPLDGRIIRLGLHHTAATDTGYDVGLGVWWRAADGVVA